MGFGEIKGVGGGGQGFPRCPARLVTGKRDSRVCAVGRGLVSIKGDGWVVVLGSVVEVVRGFLV